VAAVPPPLPDQIPAADFEQTHKDEQGYRLMRLACLYDRAKIVIHRQV